MIWHTLLGLGLYSMYTDPPRVVTADTGCVADDFLHDLYDLDRDLSVRGAIFSP